MKFPALPDSTLPALAFSLSLFIGIVPAEAQTNTPTTPSKQAKPNPAFAKITDTPGLPRILLIGDSISIGYTLPAREILKDKANVHRIPANGGPTTNGLAHLDAWLGSEKWDIIHFNWGLHDLKYMDDGKHQVSLDQYEKNLRELVRRLKATSATLIWCSTTPVPDAKVSPPRKPADVVEFNAAALEVMNENKVQINDLYAHALPELKRIQIPANVHFTDEGSRFLARKVAASIEAALAKRKQGSRSKQ